MLPAWRSAHWRLCPGLISTFFDVAPVTQVSIALECSDILVSALLTYYNLSWSSWIAIIITILATAIDLHTKDNPGVGTLFFPFFAFSVMPLVVQLYLTVSRRDGAQQALGRIKAQVRVPVFFSSLLCFLCDAPGAVLPHHLRGMAHNRPWTASRHRQV